MQAGRSSTRGWRSLPVLGAMLWLSIGADFAARPCDPPLEPDTQRTERDERGRPRDHRGGERSMGILPGGNPFRPLRQELGPLAPGEAPELMRFAREHVPRVFQLLREIEQSDPAAFDRRMQEFAPRLRHLKRIFLENAEIGRLLVEHAESNEANGQAARIYRKLPERGSARSLVLDQVRRRIARNTTIESEVFRLRIEELQQRRDELIEAHVARVLSPDAPLIGEPPPVLDLVARYWLESDDAGRTAVRQELECWDGARLDHQLDGMTERYEVIKADEPAEVERRLNRWREHPEENADRPPLPRGPHSRPARPPRP